MINKNDMLSQLYFNELESRNRIFGRLQLNFAVYASIVALFVYMVRTVDYGSSCVAVTLFFVGLSVSIVLLIWSVYLTIVALTGFEYNTFPKAKDLIDYAADLDSHAEAMKAYNSEYNQNIEIPDSEKKFEKYVSKAFSKCIDHNYEINEFRRKVIRKSIWGMVLASIPIVFSSIIFVFYDLDASSPRKVSASFNEGMPLVNAIESIHSGIPNLQTVEIDKETINMPNNELGEQESNQKQNIPPPPPEPNEPELQSSTEDFKEPLPDKAQILNEDK
ncbi:hypothetical protein EHLJMEHL_02875 [Vreelandella titanicae]